MKALLSFRLPTATKLLCLQKPYKRFREPILPGWCPPGVSPGTISNQLQPWSHVLSPRSGTTDRQSDCPSYGPGAASQHTSLLRSPLAEREPSGAYAEGSAYIWLSICLSVWHLPMSPCPLSLPFNSSIWGKERMYYKAPHLVFLVTLRKKKRALYNP